MKTIAEQQAEQRRQFVVWGMGMLPKWLKDYGATDAPAMVQGAVKGPWDWVVMVDALPADIGRYGRADGHVLGWDQVRPIDPAEEGGRS